MQRAKILWRLVNQTGNKFRQRTISEVQIDVSVNRYFDIPMPISVYRFRSVFRYNYSNGISVYRQFLWIYRYTNLHRYIGIPIYIGFRCTYSYRYFRYTVSNRYVINTVRQAFISSTVSLTVAAS